MKSNLTILDALELTTTPTMIRTFLVALDIPENSDLSGYAEEIQESLSEDGFAVSSVKAWAAPSPDPTASFLGSTELPTV